MTTRKIIINGQEFVGTFNANSELSQAIEGLDDAVLINWPRHHVCGNGTPVIDIGGGTMVRLGNHFQTSEEKKGVRDYKAGCSTGTRTAVSNTKVSEMLIKLSAAVSKYAEKDKELAAILTEVQSLQERSDPKKVAAVRAMVAAGMSEEAAWKVILSC